MSDYQTPQKEDEVEKRLDEEDALEKLATGIEKIGKRVIKVGKRVGRHHRHVRTHRTDDTHGRTTG